MDWSSASNFSCNAKTSRSFLFSIHDTSILQLWFILHCSYFINLAGDRFIWCWILFYHHRVANFWGDIGGIWLYNTFQVCHCFMVMYLFWVAEDANRDLLQFLLACLGSLSGEDTYSWLGIPTTICQIGIFFFSWILSFRFSKCKISRCMSIRSVFL